MSRFDALPADQKAVLQLLLRQGKGYEDLAELLRLEPAAVRSRAYDALDALGPGAGGVHADRRRTVSDWLLGQQGPEDAAATRAYLEGSSSGRAWAGAVARQLEPIAGERLPAIPGDEAAAVAPNGRPGAGAAQAAAAGAAAPPPTTPGAPPAAPAAPLSSPPAADETGETKPPTAGEGPSIPPIVPAPSSRPRVSRRGGAILIGGVLAAIAAVVLVVVLTSGGGDGSSGSDPSTTDAAATATTQPRVKAQVNLLPPKGAPAKKALGIVQVVDVSGQQAINAVVQGLPPTTKAGYGIWLYAGPSRQKWLGYFQSADRQGRAIAQGALRDDLSQYNEMLVTRESRRDPPRPGVIFLRGTIGPPPASGSSDGTSTGTGTGTGTGG